MERRSKKDHDVVEITSAPTNVSDEIGHRQKRYLISMAIRTACFLGAVLTFQFSWVLATVLLVASFLLPAIAVVVANSASPRIQGTPADPGFHHELGRELGHGLDNGGPDQR